MDELYGNLTFVCLIAMQCSPLFIGLSLRVFNVRPAAFFFIKCNLQSEEIQRLYSSAKDGYESTQLYTVPMVSNSNFVLIFFYSQFFFWLVLACSSA